MPDSRARRWSSSCPYPSGRRATQSRHSDLLKAARLRPPAREGRPQEEGCGDFPGTELSSRDGHGGTPAPHGLPSQREWTASDGSCGAVWSSTRTAQLVAVVSLAGGGSRSERLPPEVAEV